MDIFLDLKKINTDWNSFKHTIEDKWLDFTSHKKKSLITKRVSSSVGCYKKILIT